MNFLQNNSELQIISFEHELLYWTKDFQKTSPSANSGISNWAADWNQYSAKTVENIFPNKKNQILNWENDISLG